MTIVAYFCFGFAFVLFFVSLINLIFRTKFETTLLSSNPLVSILIPARNESENIETIITNLLQQNYNHIEIIVYDDESEDNTSEIVSKYLDDKRLKLQQSQGLPIGWLGKNYACYQLAKKAQGSFLLFLDADVQLKSDFVTKILNFYQQHQSKLISIFPKQEMLSLGEKLTVPIMNNILLTLLPLILVEKSKFSSLSAANGQCMFFERELYKEIEPHLRFKNEKVEDIVIARYLKRNNVKIACLTGDESIQCRMYKNFNEGVNGFSKNIFEFFGGSSLVAFLYWGVLTLGIVSVMLFLNIYLVSVYLFFYIFTTVFVSIVSKQNILSNLIFKIPQQFVMFWIMIKSIQFHYQKNNQWKGRNIH